MTDKNSLIFDEYHPEQHISLLFLHGGGAGAWMWQPVVDLLPDFHCLLPDLPEQGRSGAVAPFTMALAAEKCADLVRLHAHGGKAVVVGLSEGAQVAVRMLATAPEVIDRAIISSAILLPMPGGKMYSSRGLIGALFRMSVPPFRNNDWWIRLNMKHAAAIPEAFYPQFKANFQTMTEDSFVNLLVANQTFRMPAALERVNIPALVMCGKHEYAVMKKSARLLADTLPAARLFEVDLGEGNSLGKEHNWAMTAPEAFAGMIHAWLGGGQMPGVLTEIN